MRKKKDHINSTNSGRGGRPRLEDAARRGGRIGVPVNAEEDDAISGKARLMHMKKGTFLRHLGLGKQIHKPVPAINYRAYRQLGRLAADLSYALLLIQEGKSIGIDQQLAERILDELRHLEDLLVKGA